MDNTSVAQSSKRKRSVDDEVKRAAKKERRNKQKKRAQEGEPKTVRTTIIAPMAPVVSKTLEVAPVSTVSQTPIIVSVPATNAVSYTHLTLPTQRIV